MNGFAQFCPLDELFFLHANVDLLRREETTKLSFDFKLLDTRGFIIVKDSYDSSH